MNRLKDGQEPKNNNNNNLSPPPSSSFFPTSPPAPSPPPPAPFQPLPLVFDSFQPQAPRTDKNFGNFHTPAQISSFNKPSAKRPSSNLFGSQAATLTRKNEQEKVVQDSVQKELDDTIYELPDMPTLELGDGLLDALGVEANDVLDRQFVTKKEEEDVALEEIKEEYNFDAINDAFDEGDVPP